MPAAFIKNKFLVISVLDMGGAAPHIAGDAVDVPGQDHFNGFSPAARQLFKPAPSGPLDHKDVVSSEEAVWYTRHLLCLQTSPPESLATSMA